MEKIFKGHFFFRFTIRMLHYCILNAFYYFKKGHGTLDLKDINEILTFHQRYHWHRLSTPVSHPQGTNWCCGAWFSRSRAKACTRSLGPGPDGSSGTLLEGAHSSLVLRQAYSKPLETNAHDGINYLKYFFII